MHVKVGTLDELPFHHIDFQASDEHENGSDCDSQDDDSANENGYQCLKSAISANSIKSLRKCVEFICIAQCSIFLILKHLTVSGSILYFNFPNVEICQL